jgi:DNA (cytosine-5)-methyltransferase 1
MKALDLYSGVGGWSLGLSMAGIDVVDSYDIWDKANKTNTTNNHHAAHTVDIRTINPSSLPNVDIVVGSPPCTQFSLANRGGKGNIYEGLKDVEKFLEIVSFLKPKFWAMENVPRLASIMASEFDSGGVLHKFRHLDGRVMIFDMSEWGVPQRRNRCIVGNFDFDRLSSYKSTQEKRTLGLVLNALSGDEPFDPVYGNKVQFLVDHVEEGPLSWEEERMNKESKTYHPIYNDMSFPDGLDRPSRTVTATCTRVSRESIVVPCSHGFRRLTLRERASLQTFPVEYQFYGENHAQKQKMIGNAIPPLFVYHIAHAMIGTEASKVPRPTPPEGPKDIPKFSPPDFGKGSYSCRRSFRSAIPGLRFKSGVRFELSNSFSDSVPKWSIKFFYGNSKKIREIVLDSSLLDHMQKNNSIKTEIKRIRESIKKARLTNLSSNGLQDAWCHKDEEFMHPYDFIDSVGKIVDLFPSIDFDHAAAVSDLMQSFGNPSGFEKVVRNSVKVLAGLLVGSLLNVDVLS